MAYIRSMACGICAVNIKFMIKKDKENLGQ